MSNLDEIIAKVDVGRKNPNKEQLWTFIKEALAQIGEINRAYKRLIEGESEQPAQLAQIAQKLAVVRDKYKDLFESSADGSEGKLAALDRKIAEINALHTGLLKGESSVEQTIQNSKVAITNFYDYLFAPLTPESSETRDLKVKQSVEKILDFHDDLTKAGGIEAEIDRVADAIREQHADLFEPSADGKSKIATLKEEMKSIGEYGERVKKEIEPLISNTQKTIQEIEADIKTKSKEVNGLLSNATARTLAQGYRESMCEYSRDPIFHTHNAEGQRLRGASSALILNITRLVPDVVNHVLFIAPLLLIAVIFFGPYVMALIQNKTIDQSLLNSLQFSLSKLSISVPLLWISWFGQRNISQRKRLFEEYNHKYRVVQMYLMFSSKEESYKLKNLAELEGILLEVVARNPSEVLGKDETMLDKILAFLEVKNQKKNEVTSLLAETLSAPKSV